MNKTIEDFARHQILTGLDQLDEGNHKMFRLMYARNGGKRSVEDALNMTLEEVLAEVPAEKLNWALSQVETSLRKKTEATAQQAQGKSE